MMRKAVLLLIMCGASVAHAQGLSHDARVAAAEARRAACEKLVASPAWHAPTIPGGHKDAVTVCMWSSFPIQ